MTTATDTTAITLTAGNAHIAELITAADDLMTKNAKKNGLDKIKVMEKDGVVYTFPNLIHIMPGLNFRDLNAKSARDKLMELARNIAENGVLQPILLFKEGDKFYAEDGHRRLAAVNIAINELGAPTRLIPVRLAPKNSNEGERILSQINMNSGEQPTALEAAGIFGRLEKQGWSVDELAKRSGKSRSRINQLLELNALPESLKTLIRTSDIEVKATFVQDRFRVNRKDEAKTLRELEFAIETARARDYDRATAKHLPADAEPGRGSDASRKTVEDLENEIRKAQDQGQTQVQPQGEGDDEGDEEGDADNGSSAQSGGATRRKSTLTPGAPASGVVLPTQIPASLRDDAPAADGDLTPGQFKKLCYAFFAALDINHYEVKGPDAPTFNAGSFESVQQWTAIRDYLDI